MEVLHKLIPRSETDHQKLFDVPFEVFDDLGAVLGVTMVRLLISKNE